MHALRRLATHQRNARVAADGGGTFDELGDGLEPDLVRRDVVEQDERLGPAGQDVIDAVGGEVGSAVAQAVARAGDDQLRADAVGGRGEVALVVERMQPGERAEALRAGRLDGRAQPLDDGL